MSLTERIFKLAKYLLTLLFLLALLWLILSNDPNSLSVSLNLKEMSVEVNSDFVSATPES